MFAVTFRRPTKAPISMAISAIIQKILINTVLPVALLKNIGHVALFFMLLSIPALTFSPS